MSFTKTKGRFARTRLLLLLLLLLGSGPLVLTTGQIDRASAAAIVDEFPIPTADGSPFGITEGGDGALWFTEFNANKIGRISTDGQTITEFPVPTPSSVPFNITAGPDGNVWFVEQLGNRIGRVTPSGAITEFVIPTADSAPLGIAAGPDGALWFTEGRASSNKIGRITTAGVITEFPLPTAGAQPWGIAAGPDGNLWFTEQVASKIGRITPAGVITEFPTLTVGSQPTGIAAGADGNLWVALQGINAIARITPSGTITEYPIPTPNSAPVALAAAPDGALWFTERDSGKLGRITTAGAITEVPLPAASRRPVMITPGSDGNLWFSENSNGGNAIGRLRPDAPTPPPGTTYTLTITPPSGGTITANPPGPSYDPGTPVTLRATPEGTKLFTGWVVDGQLVSYANPYVLTMDAAHTIAATFGDKTQFTDLPTARPEVTNAILQLTAREVIRGYQPEVCVSHSRYIGNAPESLTPPCFGTGDRTLRAQMAVMIVRAVGWRGESHPSAFLDQCGPEGCIDDELWGAVGILQHYGVARGFGDPGTCAALAGTTAPCYLPFDTVTNIQAISFITRALVAQGRWQLQPLDAGNPAPPYPDVRAESGHRQDLLTYLHYVGPIPDSQPDNLVPTRTDFSFAATKFEPSTRDGFALYLWLALESAFAR